MRNLRESVDFLADPQALRACRARARGRRRPRREGRLRRRGGAAVRQARPGGGGCWGTQRRHERAARVGEDHAGAQDARHTSAAHDGGAHRGDEGPQRQRRGQWDARHAEAVQGAAPHRLDLRARRRREQSAAGRGVARAPRGALPGRVARVWPDRAGGLAAAPGGWPRDYLAGGGDAQLPRAGHAALFHEPVSLRACRRQEEGLPVHGWARSNATRAASRGLCSTAWISSSMSRVSRARNCATSGWRKHQRSSGSGWARARGVQTRRQGSPNSMLSGRRLRRGMRVAGRCGDALLAGGGQDGALRQGARQGIAGCEDRRRPRRAKTRLPPSTWRRRSTTGGRTSLEDSDRERERAKYLFLSLLAGQGRRAASSRGSATWPPRPCCETPFSELAEWTRTSEKATRAFDELQRGFDPDAVEDRLAARGIEVLTLADDGLSRDAQETYPTRRPRSTWTERYPEYGLRRTRRFAQGLGDGHRDGQGPRARALPSGACAW